MRVSRGSFGKIILSGLEKSGNALSDNHSGARARENYCFDNSKDGGNYFKMTSYGIWYITGNKVREKKD